MFSLSGPKFADQSPHQSSYPPRQHELPSISAFESAPPANPHTSPESIRFSHNVPTSHNMHPGWQHAQFESPYFPPQYVPGGPYDNLGSGFPGESDHISPAHHQMQYPPMPPTHKPAHQHSHSHQQHPYHPHPHHGNGMVTGGAMADRSADYRQLRPSYIDPITAWPSDSPSISDHTPTPPGDYHEAVTPLSAGFDPITEDMSKPHTYHDNQYRNS